MSQIAVRCHPYAPVATKSLQKWLRDEVRLLRKSAPEASIRLLRLSQPGPAEEIEVGWQIEIGGSLGQSPLDEESLAELLRDLRLLGLQPSVLGEQGTLHRDSKSKRRRRRSLMPELDSGAAARPQPSVPIERDTRDHDPEPEHHGLMPELNPGRSERARPAPPRENGSLERYREAGDRTRRSLMPELDRGTAGADPKRQSSRT